MDKIDSALQEVMKIIENGDAEKSEFYTELSEKIDKFTDHVFGSDNPKEWTEEISKIEDKLLTKLDRKRYTNNFFANHRLVFSEQDELEQKKDDVLEQINSAYLLASTRHRNHNFI